MSRDRVPFVYLDHNATTPVRAEAAAAMVEALAWCGNPSSVHRWGRTARQRLEWARRAVGQAIGLPEGGEIVFTSGGTEANHLALKGIAAAAVACSAIEHDSVRDAAADATIVPVDRHGIVDLAALEALLGRLPAPALISIMAANNETGVLQPIAAAARIVHRAGGLLHCDAIQAAGKTPFDMAALGIDLATVSAHKLGGPVGIAVLALRPGLLPTALQGGGGQEKGMRAGTENLPAIMGFAAAITAAIGELDAFGRLAAWRDAMEERLLAAAPGAIVVGCDVPRLPNTSSTILPGMEAAIQVMALDLAGVGVSAGAACSSGKLRPSHVLAAMGFPPDLAGSAIRISLGRGSDAADIDRLVQAWTELARRRRRAAA